MAKLKNHSFKVATAVVIGNLGSFRATGAVALTEQRAKNKYMFPQFFNWTNYSPFLKVTCRVTAHCLVIYVLLYLCSALEPVECDSFSVLETKVLKQSKTGTTRAVAGVLQALLP